VKDLLWQTIDVLQTYNGAVTAFATGMIAVFTIVLAVVTGKQASLTRQSIDLARSEFIASHRPRLIVRFLQGPFYDDEGVEFVWITFANIGDTPAIIHEVGLDLARRNKKSGHWSPPGLDATPKRIKPVTLKSGDRYVIKVTGKKPISDLEIFQDITEAYELCAVGAVRYQDRDGLTRETAFFRVSKDEDAGFEASGNSAEEYQD
jgi:hypothetical protein